MVARRSAGAVRSSDMTAKILHSTNRVYALVFLGRMDEARALYLEHRGQKDVQDGKSWEAVVLKEFTDCGDWDAQPGKEPT
jgi:hypothetical protein